MKTLAVGFVVGLILFPTVLVTLGLAGRLPIAAASEPPKWETRLAGRALAASLHRDAKGLSPLPVNEPSLLSGMRIYRNNCAGCHGEFGQPSKWGSSGFYPRAPQFAETPVVLSAPEVFVAVKHGIRYSGMGAWSTLLPDDEIWQVATFVAHIQTLPPAVEAVWHSKPQT